MSTSEGFKNDVAHKTRLAKVMNQAIANADVIFLVYFMLHGPATNDPNIISSALTSPWL